MLSCRGYIPDIFSTGLGPLPRRFISPREADEKLVGAACGLQKRLLLLGATARGV